MKSKTTATSILLVTLLAFLTWPVLAVPPAPVLLDPKAIPKYVNQLVIPPVYVPTAAIDPATGLLSHYYTVDMTQFMQQILPSPLPMTTVWGYGGQAKDAITGTPLGYVPHSPAATFEAVRGTPVIVTWQNKITSSHLFPVDPTLHWADPNGMGMPTMPYNPYPPGYTAAQSPVPLVTHLHGGEVLSDYDGGPEAWFTSTGIHGTAYRTYTATTSDSAVYYYPNLQQPATLWYHDHALGITRINVMSGLAGFYLLRGSTNLASPYYDPVEAALTTAGIGPGTPYEVPLAIQDRTFYIDGSFFFPTTGINPTIHPYWMPEFFGNTIMVNGKVWPNLNVDAGPYRLRLLDGSNARFYTLSFWVGGKNKNLPFTQIGSDGGYLKAPAPLTEITIAPGERADILIDFTGLAVGTTVLLKNTAKAPFPAGAPADPQTVGQIMQFTVTTALGRTAPTLPAQLNPTLPVAGAFPTLTNPTKTRILTLIEVMGPAGPQMILLDGQKWSAPISEMPVVGSTEDWVIVNPTADTHPIHLHLVQFQLVSRQPFQVSKYMAKWMAMNGMPPLTTPTVWPATLADLTPFLQGKAVGPPLNEQGWKDTIQMNPGEVTVIRVRFAAQDSSAYPFAANLGPGYVWHCHIIDHEDNEMMRPYIVVP